MVCVSYGSVMKIPFILLAVSLLLIPGVSAAYTMERHDNQNIQGGDYDHWDVAPGAQTAGAEESCRDRCLSDSKCTAVTYQRPAFTGTANANCWLKTGTTASQLQYQHDTVIWLKVMEKTLPQAPKAPVVSTGYLIVSTNPQGAQIFLDGIAQTQVTNYRFENLAAGTYHVRVSLAGYEDQTATAEVPANSGNGVAWTLIPIASAAPTTGTLSISSTPSGAAVIIDGVSRGVTPTTVTDLTAGSHEIRVTMSGYGDYEGTATVTAGQTTPVTVSLSTVITTAQITSTQTTSSPSTGSGTGSIEVRSQPSAATISLDGAQKGKTPAKLTNVKAGSHEVALSLAGYPDWKQTVTVKNGETASINAVMGTSAQTTGGQPAASGTGSLSVATIPAGAQVYVDGVLIGNSPTKTSGLEAGSHILLIKMDGYQELSVPVSITSGQTTEYSSSLVSGTATMNKRTPGFASVLGILAIISLLAGRRIVRP
jgi:hypothetical protein